MNIHDIGIVHVRVRNGRKKFRLHASPSSGQNGYISNECSEQQMRRFLIDQAMQIVTREIDQALRDASAKGSSIISAVPIDLTGPWKETGR